jgi:membrane associated rhomboid family serine protease
LNLNHIFLFLAIVSPLLVLARAWRPTTAYYRWRIAALVVLGIAGTAWLVLPAAAGYIGVGAWFLVLFLPALGFRKMTELAAQGDYQSALKFGAALQIVHPSAELRERVRTFRHLQSNPALRTRITPRPADRKLNASGWAAQLRNAPAVLTLIVANVLVFLFEMSAGGWNGPGVLHRIGALEPVAVLEQREYWRLFTALFLHAGFLHLGFNLFALYILGPPLERAIGATRFLACYLISGLASSAGVVGLSKIGFTQVAQLVGASGCIMGVVGAWAGFLLRHHHAPLARERLANIGLIVAIQIAFDVSTPQVSMAAHMCGLVAGFFLGLALATGRPVAAGVDPGRGY